MIDYNTFVFDIDFSSNHYDNKKDQLGTIIISSVQGGLTGWLYEYYGS